MICAKRISRRPLSEAEGQGRQDSDRRETENEKEVKISSVACSQEILDESRPKRCDQKPRKKPNADHDQVADEERESIPRRNCSRKLDGDRLPPEIQEGRYQAYVHGDQSVGADHLWTRPGKEDVRPVTEGCRQRSEPQRPAHTGNNVLPDAWRDCRHQSCGCVAAADTLSPLRPVLLGVTCANVSRGPVWTAARKREDPRNPAPRVRRCSPTHTFPV